MSVPPPQCPMNGTRLQYKKGTHGNVFTTEDLHETEEHMPLDGSGQGIQVLRMIGMRMAGGTCVICGDVRENSP